MSVTEFRFFFYVLNSFLNGTPISITHYGHIPLITFYNVPIRIESHLLVIIIKSYCAVTQTWTNLNCYGFPARPHVWNPFFGWHVNRILHCGYTNITFFCFRDNNTLFSINTKIGQTYTCDGFSVRSHLWNPSIDGTRIESYIVVILVGF